MRSHLLTQHSFTTSYLPDAVGGPSSIVRFARWDAWNGNVITFAVMRISPQTHSRFVQGAACYRGLGLTKNPDAVQWIRADQLLCT